MAERDTENFKEKLLNITGSKKSEIEEMLGNLEINDIFLLIDAVNSDDTQTVYSILDINPVSEKTEKKKKKRKKIEECDMATDILSLDTITHDRLRQLAGFPVSLDTDTSEQSYPMSLAKPAQMDIKSEILTNLSTVKDKLSSLTLSDYKEIIDNLSELLNTAKSFTENVEENKKYSIKDYLK